MKWGLLLLSMMGLLSGCQPGTGEFTQAEEVTPPPAGNSDLLTKIQNDIFTPICSECHIGSQAPLGLRLENSDVAYQFLVNVTAVGNNAFTRVLPNDSGNSFLFLKVTGDPQAGQRMPLGKAPLSAENIQLIKDWIDRGALPAAASQKLASVSVEKQSISDQTKLNASNNIQRLIQFSQPIDIQSINKQSIRVFQQISNNNYLVHENSYQLSILSNRKIELAIDKNKLLSNAIGSTLYLVIDDSLGNPILDIRGRLIDGNNNQQQGGRYEIQL